MKVWAEAVIPSSSLSATLKTTARGVYDVWLAKCMVGSAMAGSMGFNAHMANIAAAIFLATGQDPAHVVEASVGVTICEIVHDTDLYISVYLPDLMVGTVGGGTGLATQKEALALLGVAGGDGGSNARRLSEIIGATALAGELSLLSSLSEGSLARAHEALGRGKKI
jgi:hydroxymethylglutaryl-CoA reductase (NADPH)